MIDVGWWMVDSFRIQNCSFKISQPVRSVRFQEIMGCFNFGFWMMDWGEEKPNGEFWMLNGGLKTMVNFGLGSCSMLDVGCWMLDGIQHSAFKI
jgi:hypothetical protein